MQAKKSSPILKYMLPLSALVIGYLVFTNPSDNPTVTAKKAPAPKKSTSSSDDQFTAEDVNAPRFMTAATPLKDAFKPAVAKADINAVLRAGAGAEANQPNAVPSDYAGGESNWIFTGTVQENGQPEALLQDGPAGVGDFVRQGQHWKKAVIGAITTNTVAMAGPSGKKLLTLSFPAPPKDAAAAPGTAPVTPPITGPIGAPAAVDTTATDPNQAMDTTGVGNGNNGRRGRGRGGRGGGGFGGNGGGGGGGFGGFGG